MYISSGKYLLGFPEILMWNPYSPGTVRFIALESAGWHRPVKLLEMFQGSASTIDDISNIIAQQQYNNTWIHMREGGENNSRVFSFAAKDADYSLSSWDAQLASKECAKCKAPPKFRLGFAGKMFLY